MVALRHIENTRVPGQRLGRRPRDPARKLLKLGDYLTGNLPTHPPAVDYFTRVAGKWCLGRNTEFGTCGPTSLANLLLLTSMWLADEPITVTDSDIINLYVRAGNPDFDPATGVGDNGVDMTVMLSAAIKGGIGGHYPVAFAAVNGHSPEEIWAASALFGGTLWGADLSVAQQTQGSTWDYTDGSPEWGGHAILAAGRYTDRAGTREDRTGLVSWADEFTATDTFIDQQVPERYVVIFPWHLGSRTFINGVNLTALAADYQALTGRPFPTGPNPTPPAPSPPAGTSPDAQLVRDTDAWIRARHVGSNANAANALKRWRQSKGL